MKQAWSRSYVALLAVACSAGFVLPAQAGLFDDEEARSRIDQVRQDLTEHGRRLDEAATTASTAMRNQLDLTNQLEQLKADQARLRGQIEVITHELETAQQRQKDFYIDLDSRLRKLEPAVAADDEADSAGEAGSTAAPPAQVSDPAVEMRDYEAALTLYKGARYKEAAGAFERFAKEHPLSTLLPNAHYWTASSYYQQRQFKQSAELFAKVAASWPQHDKAPDALLGQANSHRDSGNVSAARAALQQIIDKYPDSKAAQAARPRLQR